MGERFTDRKRHVLTEQTIQAWKRTGRYGKDFGCLLCGDMFGVGDGYRWVFANHASSPFRRGNFFVCDACDRGDDENLRAAQRMVESINPVMRARI